MTADLDQYQQKLEELKRKYLLEFPSKLSDILVKINSVIQQGSKGTSYNESLSELKRALHTMAGSSGVFGFTELSQQIRVLESQLTQYLAQDQSQGQDLNLLQKIRLEIDQLLTIHQKQTLEMVSNDESSEVDPITSTQESNEFNIIKYVLLCGFKAKEEKKIYDQLLYFGYKPITFSNINEVTFNQSKDSWHILVINLYNDSNEKITEIIDQLKLKYGQHLPLILCHGNGQFTERYLAATLECDKYLASDLDTIKLVESIEDIYSFYSDSSERILIIDDDIDLVEYLKLFFQNQGFEFCACMQPEQLIDMISDFNPEMILMDLNMPNYDGAYLASVIRQLDQFSSIPVMYLSSEMDQKKIHFAMSKGADDFILKPFENIELVFRIKYKIQRYRFLKKHITKDGLTGLLKHSLIKQALDTELERAERLHYTLSVIMVDLDNFKHINDQYGHAIGDQVLSSLSKLFRNRFRICDLIGRYGGEEFLVILPTCTPDNAKKILDTIREDFSRLDFVAGSETFNVAFSAGISCSDTGDGIASKILKQADDLLYKAKHEGKNRVVIE